MSARHVAERFWEGLNGFHVPIAPWSKPHSFAEGDIVRWRGLALHCTKSHYAGYAATDPWDPFWGWPVDRARATWQPCGRLARWHRRRLNRMRTAGVVR